MAIKDSGILTSIHGKDVGLNAARELVTQGLVLPREYDKGIKVDKSDPTFPWRDVTGIIDTDIGAASNRPSFVTFIGGIKAYSFAVNDQVYLEYHLPHDYAKGTDVYLHAHWSHNSAALVSGGVTWGAEATHSKGFSQAVFSAPVTLTKVQAAALAQYSHMVAGFQLSAAGGAGGLLDTNLLEPESVILTRIFLSANNMAAPTSPILIYVDLNYQSTGVGTKNSTPNFY